MRVVKKVLSEAAAGDDLLDVDRLEEALLHGEEDSHLELDRERVEGGLLEELDDASAAVELGLGLGVQVGAELREGRQLAELGELALQLSADLLGGLDLRGRADAGDGEADGHRGADALVEEVGL